VPVLSAEIDAVRHAGSRHLILDLSRLEFMDSTGLRLIPDWDSIARRDGFTIFLIPGFRAAQRVFELINARAHLPFTER
jgi:anti-anti-sigma factor